MKIKTATRRHEMKTAHEAIDAADLKPMLLNHRYWRCPVCGEIYASAPLAAQCMNDDLRQAELPDGTGRQDEPPLCRFGVGGDYVEEYDG